MLPWHVELKVSQSRTQYGKRKIILCSITTANSVSFIIYDNNRQNVIHQLLKKENEIKKIEATGMFFLISAVITCCCVVSYMLKTIFVPLCEYFTSEINKHVGSESHAWGYPLALSVSKLSPRLATVSVQIELRNNASKLSPEFATDFYFLSYFDKFRTIDVRIDVNEHKN